MTSVTKAEATRESASPTAPAYTRRHRRLQVAVWQNESRQGPFFNVTVQRSYQDADEWKRMQASLNREDLLVAAKLLNWAHSAVVAALTHDAKPAAAKQPVSSQRYRNLEAAVWRHEGEQGAYFTVSLQRSYRVEDQWQDTSISLGNDDLLPMARLLERAHDAIDDLYEAGGLAAPESTSHESTDDEVPF